MNGFSVRRTISAAHRTFDAEVVPSRSAVNAVQVISRPTRVSKVSIIGSFARAAVKVGSEIKEVSNGKVSG